MSQQTKRKFKNQYAVGPCVLILGMVGILWGLMTTPDQFPTLSLYLAGLGSIVSVVIPQNF